MSAQERFERGGPSAPSLWRAVAGWSLWAVCLSVLYAGHALGCRMAAGGTILSYFPAPPMSGAVSWGLAVVWAVGIVAHAVLAARSWRRMRIVSSAGQRAAGNAGALAMLAWVMDASAMAATVVIGLPVIAVPACTA